MRVQGSAYQKKSSMGNSLSLEKLVFPGHLNPRAVHQLEKSGFLVGDISAEITNWTYAVDATVAAFHGNMEDFAQVACYWKQLSVHRLIGFEYPGYAWRAGETCSQKTVLQDVELQVKLLRQATGKIFVCGRSLGTFAALQLALALGADKCDGLVLISPMLSAIATKIHPPMHRALHYFDLIDNETAAKALNPKIPVLILHGTDDTVVPVSNARVLKDLLPNAKYVEMIGVGHNDLCSNEKTWVIINEFMQKHSR
jgi:pimeloyl-ACP methyl ester carboxylesterase